MSTPDNPGLALRLAVARAQREIRADVRSGRVPADVGSFAQLHDFVDANDYGGCEAFDGSDESCRFWNAVQDELDQWVRAGSGRRRAGRL
jgi:hypothetical protein